jgi:hypothetical protein
MIGNKIYEDTFFNMEGTKGHAQGKVRDSLAQLATLSN